MKCCILHDAFRGIGGGEKVAIEFSRLFIAPIYTCWKGIEVDGAISISQKKYDRYKFLRHPPFDKYSITSDFASLSLEEFDAIIINHEYALAYKPTKGQKVLIYYNSKPMPWVFNHARWDIQAKFWKRWYCCNINKVNKMIANSEFTRDWIRDLLDREATVIYPPVDTESFRFRAFDDFYLYIGRIERGKRVAEIVEKFSNTGYKLKVAGASWDKKYKQLVRRKCERSDNCEYIGTVSEEYKRKLLGECKAVIYTPKDEPFGIVPVEAFASGKPVLGIDEGFLSYLISNGFNGVLINSLDELPTGLEFMDNIEWKPKKIKKFSRAFDVSNFREKMKRVVNEIE